jgi:hypothetical protein
MKTLEKWYVWDGDFKKLGVIEKFILSGGEVVGHFRELDCYPTEAVAYTLGEQVESKRGAK